MDRPGRFMWIGLLLLLSLASRAAAEPPSAGKLTATKACPAYQSFKKKTNPGDVQISAGQAYVIVARNKVPATWLQVHVEGAAPKARWVEVGCGTADVSTGPPPTNPGDGSQETHLLALSWQPTFCFTHPDKTECAAQTSPSAESRQLSLHGLWPQPNGTFYCIDDSAEKARLKALDGAKKWDQLPAPKVSPQTLKRLADVMPGLQSHLERHEWVKHGTCFGGTAENYFNRSADLVEQVNASPVGALLAANVGKSVKVADLEAAFKAGFGPDALAAVVVKCKGGRIDEVTISLTGDVVGSAPLRELFQASKAPETCATGILTEAKPPS